MRKILKGIITSVFALSLILPTTVTMVHADTNAKLDLSGTPTVGQNYYNKTTGLGTTITGTDLQNYIATYPGFVNTNYSPGEQLVFDLSGRTINGGFQIFLPNVTIYGATINLGPSYTGGASTTAETIKIIDSNCKILNCKINSSQASANVIEIGPRNSSATSVTYGTTIPAYRTTGSIDNVTISGNEISATHGTTGNLVAINSNSNTGDPVNNLTISSNTLTGNCSSVLLNKVYQLGFSNNKFLGSYSTAPTISNSTINGSIRDNQFKGNSSLTSKFGLNLINTGNNFNVENNEFQNCDVALYVDKSTPVFKNNILQYNATGGTIPGMAQVNSSSDSLDKLNQNTHDYNSVDNVKYYNGLLGYTYYYGPKTSTSDNSTSAPTYWPGYYYPPTTTTPATKVDDPFVYKDTPISTPTTTTTPTTTDTTSRRDRTDRTTRSSRTANAVINASNKTIVAGSSFNFKEGVTATDNGGNGASLTNKVTITGSINTLKPGTYPITYKVTGANGVAVSKVVTVTVKAK